MKNTEPKVLRDTALLEANKEQYKKELDALVELALDDLSKTYGIAQTQAIIMHTAAKMVRTALPILPLDAVEDYRYVADVNESVAIGTYHDLKQEGRA